jgi:Bacterial archaeo-eukaryotic release factor family 3
MNQAVSPEIREVMGAVHYRPAVSIIMPFEPKMNLKTEILHSLKLAADKVELELQKHYPDELKRLVMQKLNNIFKNLNFTTHKKSIAIYVSPVFEKVLYLDIAVEKKIIVDESFEIRDLVYSKKQMHKYLVLLLSGKESRIYLGNSESFARIVTNTNSVQDYVNEVPQRVANFSDISERREIIMDKFLHHVDNSLHLILNAYHLPLFIAGTERILGHFKSMTKHKGSVIEYIHGNYEEATLHELKQVLEPHISDWKKVMQKDLFNQIEEAEGKKKLAAGIKDVWKEAVNHKGRLLVVEKNYMFPAEHGSSEEIITNIAEPYNQFSYIKDAVDDAIEKVLEGGGDVEFTDEGLLSNYGHIVLIQYY